ncbi:MAG: heme ABC transporter ATP-binding protein [Gammaproteobacteria bacterium]|nr:heme ABC transporter ATP-binding protein [Gammaproteobacteria bacterium]
MLKISNLSVRAGGKVLLDDLTLAFAAGELVMVVGPNGAGKTTLLRCLDGELTPAHGQVELAGRALRDWPRRELARVRAVLPQQSTLDFPFSVRDVVLMGRIPHSSGDAEDRAIATQALQMCDCAGLEERAYPSLSGGEQQRVQTARVLAQMWGPGSATGRFLLLDEPASALDLSHQYALLNLLKNLTRTDRIGVICTLHNLNLVAQFADRAVVIDRGILVADGAPFDVFTEETIGHVFDLDVAIHPHPDDAKVPLLIPRLPRPRQAPGAPGAA